MDMNFLRTKELKLGSNQDWQQLEKVGSCLLFVNHFCTAKLFRSIQYSSWKNQVTIFSAPNYCGEFDNAAAVPWLPLSSLNRSCKRFILNCIPLFFCLLVVMSYEAQNATYLLEVLHIDADLECAFSAPL